MPSTGATSGAEGPGHKPTSPEGALGWHVRTRLQLGWVPQKVLGGLWKAPGVTARRRASEPAEDPAGLGSSLEGGCSCSSGRMGRQHWLQSLQPSTRASRGQGETSGPEPAGPPPLGFWTLQEAPSPLHSMLRLGGPAWPGRCWWPTCIPTLASSPVPHSWPLASPSHRPYLTRAPPNDGLSTVTPLDEVSCVLSIS